MKLQARQFRRGGYMLVEALAYISAVVVLTSVGYVAMYRLINNSLALRRGAEDIAKAMNACERWRQDVRNAEVARQQETPEGMLLTLESAARTNAYLFARTNLSRRVGESQWVVIMPKVMSSAMEPCEVGGARGWKWNFELEPRSKNGRVRPLFTCTAALNTQSK